MSNKRGGPVPGWAGQLIRRPRADDALQREGLTLDEDDEPDADQHYRKHKVTPACKSLGDGLPGREEISALLALPWVADRA